MLGSWAAGGFSYIEVGPYSPQNRGLGLYVIGVEGLKAIWQFGKEVCSPETSKNPHGGFAVCSHRASATLMILLWMSTGMGVWGKGDTRAVLKKEMSYCFSLDR